jgi:hypothetical protein
MSEYLFTECYILPQKLIFIPYWERNRKGLHVWNEEKFIESFNKVRDNNKISVNSRRKLWYALMTLQAISTPQKAYNFATGQPFTFLLNFITLTLPALNFDYSDIWLKRNILNNFWSNVKYKYDLRHFVSKYEPQKNGNLHIHITTNTYIHYTDLNNIWNRCLSHTNLINLYRNKFNNHNPNSTDIHAIRKLNSIYQEFLKYISKDNEDRRKISGRLWSCSRSLEFNNRLHFTLTDELYNDYKYIEKRFNDNKFSTEYFDCYSFQNKYSFSKLPKSFMDKYNSHLEYIKSL